MANNPGVVKTIINSGYRYVPITDGCKTWKLDKQRTLLDDSRKIGKKEPITLVIGHKFKLPVWENVIKLMAVGEVASFKVKQDLLFNYPFISKTIREMDRPQGTIKHTCSATLHKEGLGYEDLDSLINYPCDLEFIFGWWSPYVNPDGSCTFPLEHNKNLFRAEVDREALILPLANYGTILVELIKVEREHEYEKDIWQLSVEERTEKIPELKERGNVLYGQKNYDEAEECYKKAIGIIEQFMLREQKGDDEWNKWNNQKLPLLLNYCQCKLIQGEYYPVIEYCTYVLKYDKDNEKALYRRAKAYLGTWDPEKAEDDFLHLKRAHPAMAPIVDKELEVLYQLKKDKREQDKEVLKRLFAAHK